MGLIPSIIGLAGTGIGLVQQADAQGEASKVAQAKADTDKRLLEEATARSVEEDRQQGLINIRNEARRRVSAFGSLAGTNSGTILSRTVGG